MTISPPKRLKALKAINLANWKATFWLVKRKAVHREANYSVMRANIDARLERRLKGYLKAQIQTHDFHLEPYAFTNADTDDVLLTLEADATDFAKVEKAISDGFENALVQEYEDLMNSWAYVVQFEQGTQRLYAWRKINATTDPKRVLSKGVLFFEQQRLVDVEDKQVFLIDPNFDFFVFEGLVFIARKSEFERSMNFREGMKDHGNDLLEELTTLNILSDVTLIRDYVGDNLNHLRKLASIRKAGYYRQPDYMIRLMKVSLEEGWDLKVVGDKILVELETLDVLLTLLNNDRLRSPINNELFDSAAKKTVATRSSRA